MWFRRDLRLGDNPALLEAVRRRPVLPLFVLDPALWGPAGPVPPRLPRRLAAAPSTAGSDGGGPGSSVVRGDPVRRVVLAAQASRRRAGARRRRLRPLRRAAATRDVEQALADARHRAGAHRARRTPSPRAGSATAPATPTRSSRRSPGPGPTTAGAARSTRRPERTWLELDEDTTDIPEPALPDGLELPEAGEAAARRRWRGVPATGSPTTTTTATGPGVDGTSRMSVHLKWGEIHPRTMLADLARLRSAGAATYRKELAWREFYADVLFHQPGDRARVPAPRVRADGYDEPGGAARGVAGAAAPASRSSTPGCASCARPAGCTTGCG